MPIQMTHHDGRNYLDAVSEAAKAARYKMERMLEDGAENTKKALARIEQSVPVDALDFGKDLVVYTQEQEQEGKEAFKLLLEGKYVPKDTGIHRHALHQMRERVGAPDIKYLDRMLSGTKAQRERVTNLLNQHLAQDVGNQRFLARTLDGEMRGFLSSQYKRWHSPSLFNLFVEAAQQNGAVVVGGDGTDLRHTLRAFLPNVFEPVPNEVFCLGVEMLSGDFGDSRYVVRMIINRLWCTNLATMFHGIKRNHLGSKLPEDIVLSEKTMQLDTELLVSASQDVIKDMLSPARVATVLSAIKSASEADLKWEEAEKLLAKHLRKPELENAKQMFETDQDIAGPVPAVKSFYKASQILSWQANQVEGERRLDLIQASGQVMDRFLKAA